MSHVPRALPQIGQAAPLLPSGVPHSWNGRTLSVTDPLKWQAGGRATVTAVAFLRECQSRALAVMWSADTAGRTTEIDPSALRHLPPPVKAASEPPTVASWREWFRYGLFYYRIGPDFITVRDRRWSPAGTLARLDHPLLVATFVKLLTPVRFQDLDPANSDAAKVLVDGGLVLLTQGWLVTLPARMSIWPVPSSEV